MSVNNLEISFIPSPNIWLACDRLKDSSCIVHILANTMHLSYKGSTLIQVFLREAVRFFFHEDLVIFPLLSLANTVVHLKIT